MTTTTRLARKLAEVQLAVSRVPKRGRNDFHGYDYATEADILECVRTELAERHIAIIPGAHVDPDDIRPIKTARGGDSAITTARMSFEIIDGETGERYTADWVGQGEDPGDKGAYKALTGGLKYFLLKLFLIPTGDDPEADRGSDERTTISPAQVADQAAAMPGTREEPQQRRAGQAGGGARLATEKQRKFLFAIAKSNDVELTPVLERVAGVESLDAVPARMVDAIASAIKGA